MPGSLGQSGARPSPYLDVAHSLLCLETASPEAAWPPGLTKFLIETSL